MPTSPAGSAIVANGQGASRLLSTLQMSRATDQQHAKQLIHCSNMMTGRGARYIV